MKYFFLLLAILFIADSNDYLIKVTSLGEEGRYDYYPKKFKKGIIYTSFLAKEGVSGGLVSQIFYSKISENEFLSKPINIEVEGVSWQHCGSPEYVPSSNEFYFSMNNEIKSPKEVVKMGLYKGRLQNDMIIETERLLFCSPDFDFTHLTISDNGLTLIFSSSLNGTMKLYEAKRDSINEGWEDYSLIKGITGKTITFPNLLNDSLLTYAKKTENNDFDIFIAKNKNGVWSESKNWEELNSTADDFGVEMIDSTSGYFTSNREGKIDKIFYFNTEN